MFSIQGKSIFLFSNGSIRKIPRCNVQLCQPEESIPETAASVQDKDEIKRSVNFNDKDITEKELEEPKKQKTRSMTVMETRELERDRISTFWMRMENTECYDDIVIYTVEVPVREHKKVEVIEAKDKELENLMKYNVFDEVNNEGQETISSRWVITKKEKADG